MPYFFQKIYTVWCAIVFISVFLILFPFFCLIIPFKRVHHLSYYLNKVWARLSLFLVGIPVTIQGREYLNKNNQYVYCSNHFSLLDILSFGYAPHCVLFVGKSSLAKVPLFGFMFKKIHITVDRSSLRDSYKALQIALKKIGDNKSLVMFPEGGVYSQKPPNMVRFKDGAFRAAISKQIAIVPVTLPNNWIILPDTKIPIIRRTRMVMKFHPPISTVGMSLDDVDDLKKNVFQIIQFELDQSNYSVDEHK